MNAQLKITPTAARGAAVHSVSILDPDGKVIISTLPSEFASGADLLKALHPALRRELAAGEGTDSDRYFFCTDDSAFILLTSLLKTHGVMISVGSDSVKSEEFARISAKYGFEALSGNACTHAVCPSAAEALRFALGLERLFSKDGAPIITDRRAQKFFNGFSSVANVRAEIGQMVRRKTLFDGVDYVALGLATLLVSALASSLGAAEILVSLGETDDRRSVKAEFEVNVGANAPDAQDIEVLFGGILALKCKNLHVENKGSSLVFSLCPAVFDPDAQGLMQGQGVTRTERRKK